MQLATRPTTAQGTARYRVGWTQRLPYPARNVLRRWRGLIGMMIGVGIALSVVTTLLGMSQGNIDIYTSDYLKSGADLYVIRFGGTLIPILPGDSPGVIRNGSNLLAQIRGLPSVGSALGIVNGTLERTREGPKRPNEKLELIAVQGVDGDPAAVPGMLLLREGRWLRRSNEIVVGSKLSQEKGIGLGSTLRLDGHDYTVVGIGRLRGFSFSTSSLAYVDFRTLRDRTDLGDTFNIIAVDAAAPDEVAERVRDLGSYQTSDPPDLVRQAQAANASAQVVYWIFNGLALAVGALFIGQMLARSVAERRLEFATMRAIGIPTRTILFTVAAEAALISVVAGFIGAAISLGFGSYLNATVAPAYGIESMYSATVDMFLAVFALAIGLGLVAGLFPARSATRVDPVDVLREA